MCLYKYLFKLEHYNFWFFKFFKILINIAGIGSSLPKKNEDAASWVFPLIALFNVFLEKSIVEGNICGYFFLVALRASI